MAASLFLAIFFSSVPEFPLPLESTVSPPMGAEVPSESQTVTYGGFGAFSFIAACLFILGRKTFSRNIQVPIASLFRFFLVL